MKCSHCGRELAFMPRVDRASGQTLDIYRCTFCGTEMRDPRPKKQIGRY
jgi:DNA-directed RNA polymerase subunit RPC12/RpoP